MTNLDLRFERDLRAVLDEMAPADAPTRLRDAVASVPQRPVGRRWPFGTGGRLVALAAAATVIVVASVALGGLLGRSGVEPGVGGPGATESPSPSASGTLHLEYQVMPAKGLEPTPDDVAAVAAVIARRLATTGIVAPSVTTAPSGRIVVELAVDPSDDTITIPVRTLIGTTGKLDFVPLGTTSVEAGQTVDLTKFPPLLSGDGVAAARIGQDQGGLRTVDLTLDPDAAALFAAYTRDHIGEYFALVADGGAITVPVIQSAIEDGEMQFTGAGQGGLAEAQALVAVIESGPLPFPVQEVANNLR